eukprot:1151031-Pelagomonas_calceolata.AAC.5
MEKPIEYTFVTTIRTTLGNNGTHLGLHSNARPPDAPPLMPRPCAHADPATPAAGQAQACGCVAWSPRAAARLYALQRHVAVKHNVSSGRSAQEALRMGCLKVRHVWR